MAELSSIINTPDMPTAGQTEGVVTPMALENNQSIEQDNSLTLDGQIDQAKGTSNVSSHMQFLSIRAASWGSGFCPNWGGKRTLGREQCHFQSSLRHADVLAPHQAKLFSGKRGNQGDVQSEWEIGSIRSQASWIGLKVY